jgi:hypothetical protein
MQKDRKKISFNCAPMANRNFHLLLLWQAVQGIKNKYRVSFLHKGSG